VVVRLTAVHPSSLAAYGRPSSISGTLG